MFVRFRKRDSRSRLNDRTSIRRARTPSSVVLLRNLLESLANFCPFVARVGGCALGAGACGAMPVQSEAGQQLTSRLLHRFSTLEKKREKKDKAGRKEAECEEAEREKQKEEGLAEAYFRLMQRCGYHLPLSSQTARERQRSGQLI